jgi:hypothetical protein
VQLLGHGCQNSPEAYLGANGFSHDLARQQAVVWRQHLRSTVRRSDIGCVATSGRRCHIRAVCSPPPSPPQHSPRATNHKGMHFFFKDPRWQTSTVTTMEQLEAGARGFQDTCSDGARFLVVAPPATCNGSLPHGDLTELLRSLMTSRCRAGGIVR